MNEFVKQYQEALESFVRFFNHTKIVNAEIMKEFKNRLEWFNNYAKITNIFTMNQFRN